MKQIDYSELLSQLREVARKAGSEIMQVYESSIDVNIKTDGSPVTLADEAAERVILNKVEIRVRTMWIFEGIEYYYESPNDNVYNLDGTYVGKKKNGKINKYYVED